MIRNALKKHIHDPIIKRFLKNAGMLFTGDSIYALITIICTLITARALGPKQFGILITIQTYVIVVDRLINFQSWPALIKYGTECLHDNKTENFKKLIKLGVILDSTTAVLGTALAIIGILVINAVKTQSDYVIYALLYCIFILSNLTGTFIAILRLFNKFKHFVYQKLIISILKLIAICVAYFLKAPFWSFFFIFLITDILANLILIAFGTTHLIRRNLHTFWKTPLTGITQIFPGVKGFFLSTNIASSIRMLSREFDILILSVILGSKAAGLFKIAKLFANIPNRIYEPFFYTIYPELAKLWKAKDIRTFNKLVHRTSIAGGLATAVYILIFIFVGKLIITKTTGMEYGRTYMTAILYLLATLVAGIIMPYSPAILAAGKHKWYLLSLSAATVVYFVALPGLITLFHINGASAAYILFYVTYSLIIWKYFNQLSRVAPSEQETDEILDQV